MAYNYLGLVNNVNEKLNEVPLTSVNFGAATGYYADVKNNINTALVRMNTQEFEWPFNFQKQTDTLIVDQTRYAYPANAKSVAFDTVRLKKSSVLNVDAAKLEPVDYEEWLEKCVGEEDDPSEFATKPQWVFRCRNLEYGVSPPPDQAYQVVYDYYKFPPQLENWDDVPLFPEQFRWIIVHGALTNAYLFRGAETEAQVAESLFTKGIADMRKIYVNRTEYARSSVIRS